MDKISLCSITPPPKRRRALFVLVLLTLALFMGGTQTPQLLAAPTAGSHTPAYYFDHETAYVIEHSIDATNGGMFLALDPSTNEPFSTIPVDVYGASSMEGTDKYGVGQAVCVRYFVQEYQRITNSGEGTVGINDILSNQMTSPISLAASSDLLTTYAASCADFIIDNMVIPVDDNVSGGTEACSGGGSCGDDADQGDTGQPNMYYYWGSTGEDGTSRLLDDTQVNASLGAARAHSSLAWSLSELALVLKEANNDVCGADCAKYRDAAIDYWNWRHTSALATPTYNSNNLQVGVSRDLFYSPLGFVLADVTGDASYQNGGASSVACPAANNADGSVCGAMPFMNSYTGTGAAPNLPYPAPHALNDGAYMAGYARAIAYAHHSAEFPNAQSDRDQWWDFGWFTTINDGTKAVMSPTELTSKHGSIDYSVPFAHFGGREVLAGTQRAHMFYSTFGANPTPNWPQYDAGLQSKENFSTASVQYWDYMIDNLWDDASGQRSWYESTSKQFKPCFSAGTEVPFADSQPPIINSVSHDYTCADTGLTEDITFNVNTDDLSLEMDYMSWTFKGSGVDSVEILWTCDSSVASGGDASAFNTFALSGTEPAYSGTLDGSTLGAACGSNTSLYYFTRVVDQFGNATSLSPNGTPEQLTTAEDWWSPTEATLSTDLADFGLVTCAIVGGSEVIIGDRVWHEDDGDGDATTGTVTPVVGATVTATDSSGTPYSGTTDASGNYTITVPANATYTVTVATPVGYVPSALLVSGVDNDPALDNDQNHKSTGAVVTVADADNLTIDFGFTTPAAPTTCGDTATDLGGTLFRDVDYNGLNNISDGNDAAFYAAGITIYAYDNDNNVVGQTTVQPDGTYNFESIFTNNEHIRLEFTNLPDYLDAGYAGSSNGTLTQNHQAATCEADLGVHISSEYCEENPQIVTFCFAVGDADAIGDDPSVVSSFLSEAKSSGTEDDAHSTSHNILVPYGEVGSVWGIAYDRYLDMIFTGAIAKTHTMLGADGIGAIYAIDNSTNTGANSVNSAELWLDLESASINIDVGEDPYQTEAYTTGFNSTAFAAFGKHGLGDLDMAEDISTLFAINLNGRSLLEIPVGPNGEAPTLGSEINETVVPTPASCSDTVRPFAVKYHNGEAYVGMVCTGEVTNADADQRSEMDRSMLRAYVYAYDPATDLFGATPVLEFDLAHDRTWSDKELSAAWYPWTDRWNFDMWFSYEKNEGDYRISFAQPLLTDIEFDGCEMIVSIADRFGNQFNVGETPLSVFSDGTTDQPDGVDSVNVMPAGEILMAGYNGDGTWAIESNGQVTSVCGDRSSINNDPQNKRSSLDAPHDSETGSGPGGSEFFWGDYYGSGHNEVTLGAVAIIPNSSQVIATAYDPLQFASGAFGIGGLTWLNTTNGEFAAGLKLYEGAETNFNKGAGFGDVEVLCQAAPLEIGNYIWVDDDSDGIQDPCEDGLGDITVELYNIAGTLLATTTTSTEGEYYLNDSNVPGGIQPQTSYHVCVLLADADLGGRAITLQDYASNGNHPVSNISTDVHDSDGDNGTILAGHSCVEVTTGQAGENDHSIDFGFKPASSVQEDWGDLPDDDAGASTDSYATNSTDGNGEGLGASHVITADLYLGDCVDSEADGQPSAAGTANQDDSALGIVPAGAGTCASADDEDGVTFTTPLIPGKQACIHVSAQTAAAQAANLSAWIGNAGDGTLTQVLTDVAPISGTMQSSGIYEHCFTVPASSGHDGTLYARFRLSTESGLAATGPATDGEVEDYALALSCVGNFVFTDENGDNVQDAGDSAISGVAVNLVWGGADGLIGSGSDDIVYTATTTADGKYHFCGLPDDANGDGSADEYQLSVPTLPAAPVMADQGGDEAVDSDGDTNGAAPVFTLPTGNESADTASNDSDPDNYADGATDLSFDFGFARAAASDWGDLPDAGSGTGADDYNTLNADGGASHIISSTLHLGNCIDAESDGQPSAADSANEDDDNGAALDASGTCATVGDDEDGIVFTTPIIADAKACLDVTSSQAAILNAFVDFNGDGVLDAVTFMSEDGAAIAAPAADNMVQAGTHEYCFDVPSDVAHGGTLYSRFRLSSQGGLDATGAALDGEVEDYAHTLSCVGNYLFTDVDGDDVQSAGDTPIAGVDVALTWGGADGVIGTGSDDVVYTDTTDATGLYHFCGLPEDANRDASADQYQISVPTLPGTPVMADQGGDEALDSDGDTNGDAPVFTLPTGSESSDVASNDSDPDSYSDIATDLTFDFGFSDTVETVSIGNLVWEDSNNSGYFDVGERGIPNVAIELWLDNGDGIIDTTVATSDTRVLTTTTDVDGEYGFSGVTPGNYFVRIPSPPPAIPFSSTPLSSLDTAVDNDDNGEQPGGANTEVLSSIIALAVGEEPGASGGGNFDYTVDFGLVDPTIGNLVWHDENNDGVVQSSEAGIPGVTVTILYDANNDGEFVSAETVPYRTTVTDSNGFYIFMDLVPGANYQVVLPEENFATGGALESLRVSSVNTNIADSNIDDDDNGIQTGAGLAVTSPIINLQVDQEPVDGSGANDESGRGATFDNGDDDNGNMTIDFGLWQPVEIGNQVWIEDDADGDSSTGNITPVPNAGLVALATDGTVYTTTTDADGYYTITVPANGTYTVMVEVPAGTLPSGTLIASSDDASDPDGMSHDGTGTVVTVGTEDNNTIDFGFKIVGSIGDLVWQDTDGDSVLDSGENGIAGVVIELEMPDGTTMTTTTDSVGFYTFANLSYGTYTVIVDTDTLPSAMAQTFDDDGMLDDKSTTTIGASMPDDVDQDFGYRAANGSLGSRIWFDINGDGVIDGEEDGIAGVVIEVETPTGLVITTTTDSNGNYQLTGLPFGSYTVTVDSSTLPADLVQTFDDDGSLNHRSTVTLSGEAPSNMQQYFGYQPPLGSIGDFVWLDVSGDGAHDADEVGIGGVVVSLTSPDGSVITTMTSATGSYMFAGLPMGVYTVTVDAATLPAPYLQSYDADGVASAHYSVYSLGSGEDNVVQDFGYAPEATAVALRGLGADDAGNSGYVVGIIALLMGASSVAWMLQGRKQDADA